jgi:hypothetical protein
MVIALIKWLMVGLRSGKMAEWNYGLTMVGLAGLFSKQNGWLDCLYSMNKMAGLVGWFWSCPDGGLSLQGSVCQFSLSGDSFSPKYSLEHGDGKGAQEC